jgi:hypothetical protein
LLHRVDRILSIVDDAHRVTVATEIALDHLRDHHLVFHHEHAVVAHRSCTHSDGDHPPSLNPL